MAKHIVHVYLLGKPCYFTYMCYTFDLLCLQHVFLCDAYNVVFNVLFAVVAVAVAVAVAAVVVVIYNYIII